MNQRAKDNVEGKILSAIRSRGDNAIAEKELSRLTGIRGNSFKEAIIRLLRKELIAKWKSEKFVNYVVAKEHSGTAYYLEPVVINPLYLAFGHEQRVIEVQRSIPFVMLGDDDVETRSRYKVA